MSDLNHKEFQEWLLRYELQSTGYYIEMWRLHEKYYDEFRIEITREQLQELVDMLVSKGYAEVFDNHNKGICVSPTTKGFHRGNKYRE